MWTIENTARLAVTAGLCASIALGGLAVDAVAAEVTPTSHAVASAAVEGAEQGVATVTIDGKATSYASLEEAVNAAPNGATVTLNDNASGNGIKVKENSSFILDLGGNTYTVDGATVGSTGTETNGFQLLKGSTLTFKNGTIKSEKAKILIQNYSNLTLEGITLQGGRDTQYTLSNNNGDTHIGKGASIIAGQANPGVAFDVCRFASYPSVTVTVDEGAGKIVGGIEVSNGGSGTGDFKLTVNGGDLSGAEMNVITKGDDAATIEKSAGVAMPAPDGFAWVNGVLTEDGAAQDAVVATITVDGVENGYTSLAAAFKAAPAGATVKLAANVEESVTVSKGMDVTLDLAGNTLTAAKDGKAVVVDGGKFTLTDSKATGLPKVSADYETIEYASGKVVASDTAVAVYNGGSFVFDGGTIVSTADCGVYVGAKGGADGSFTMRGGYIEAQEYGIGVMNQGSSVTVEGGVVVAKDNAALAGNGTKGYGGTSITVSGGTLISHIQSAGYIACGIYHPQDGKLTITGGTIYADGGAGIVARAGSADITGGTIIATGSAKGYVGDKKTEVPSAGIVVDRAAGYPGATDADLVKVSGDAVVTADEGVDAVVVLVNEGASKENLVEVSGGKFSTPVADEFLAEGFKPTQLPDGSYGVHKHVLVKIEEVAATVDAAGTKAHYKCSSCGELFWDAEGAKPVADPSELVIAKLPGKPGSTGKPSAPSGDKLAQTGDASVIAMASTGLAGAAAVATGALKRRRAE